MNSKSNTIISIILIVLLIILVAFLYFQNNNPKANIFVPQDSQLFLATKNSNLENFFTLDQDFKNISGEKIFYVGSGRKNYIFQNKILGTSGFYQSSKLDNYNISKAFEDYKNKIFDGFFVKDIFGEKLFGTSSGNNITIFIPSTNSKKSVFQKPTDSDFFFSWGDVNNIGFEKFSILLESEYFSGFSISEKSNLKKFFSTPGAINISNGWQIISSFTGEARFFEKLDSIGFSGNFFSGENLKFGTKNFDFASGSQSDFEIFGSKNYFPYSFYGKSNFEYGYQKFDIILN